MSAETDYQSYKMFDLSWYPIINNGFSIFVKNKFRTIFGLSRGGRSQIAPEIYSTTPAAARLVTSNPEDDNVNNNDDDDMKKIKVSFASCLLIEYQRNRFCLI